MKVRVREVRKDEHFFDEQGELYRMTHRGPRILHDSGEDALVQLDPEAEVTLDVVATRNRERADMSMELVNDMVAKGFTFFSSALTTTRNQKTYKCPVNEAWTDAMFFTMENVPIIIKVMLKFVFLSDHNVEAPITHYWAFDVYAKSVDYDTAPTPGQMPLFQTELRIPNFSCKGSGWTEGRALCAVAEYVQWGRAKPRSPHEVALRVYDVYDNIRIYLGTGGFGSLDVTEFSEEHEFPYSSIDFWPLFNRSYLNKLVRKVEGAGLPDTSKQGNGR